MEVPRNGTTSTGFGLLSEATATVAVRLYAADAARKPDGTFTVGDSRGASWVRLSDQAVSLSPGEARHFRFEVTDPAVPEGTEAYAAVVEEIPQGSITLRSATIVYARVAKRPGLLRRHLPLVLVVVALVVMVLLVAAQVQAGRVRRHG